MKVLSISMDRKLFEAGSAVLQRSLEYATKMQELHIVVFSLKKHNLSFMKIDNLYIYPTNSYSRITFLVDAYRLGKRIIKINEFIIGKSVITAQDPMSIVGYLLSKKFKLPLQLQIHTDIFNKRFKNSLTSWVNFWYSGWINVPLTNFLIPRAQGVRVVGQFVADEIKDKFPRIKARVDVLPVFVDSVEIMNKSVSRYIKNDYPNFDQIILMASRLTREKRIDIALHSFKKVLEKHPDTGLVISGSGTEESNLVKLSQSLGINNSVVFSGWQNDIISLYKTADIFLLTSEYEGYGMTLIEAGASGCPIISTKVGIAQTDLFKDGFNSHICPVGDVDCLSEKLIDLITNEEKRKLFKQRMQDSIRGIAISREEYVVRYVDLLKKLIKNV